MTSVLRSRTTTAVGFAVAGLGFVSLLYSEVPPFSNYRGLFSPLLAIPWAGPYGLLGLAVLLAGLGTATLSCLLDADRRSGEWLHRFDYFLVLVAWLATWSLVAGFFEKGRANPFWHLVCLTVLAGTGCYLWATTFVRLGSHTLASTILWPRVFRTLRLNQFSGIFILVVTVIAGVLLLSGVRSVVGEAMSYSSWQDIALSSWLLGWFAQVGLPALTLAVVSILSLNILSITAAKERAIEEKLREERFRAELITNVTHDLRTPLTSIVNYVDLIGKLDLDDPQLAEYTDVLGRKAARLTVLIGDLLDASRASAGNLPVRLAPLELTEILAQIAGDFDAALTARHLTWVGPGTVHAHVLADGEHLWRILENLLGNVTKYAKPGTCVHADLERTPGVVALRLSNLTPEPLDLPADQLTAQFVRGDAARHSEGSGLGLFIADRLARLMNATLTVAADADRFAVTVTLPAARPAVVPAGLPVTGGVGLPSGFAPAPEPMVPPAEQVPIEWPLRPVPTGRSVMPE
ncbi:MAG: HAMP domain-containing sensor histidine kinase [Propionicimonas sp.]|nr:HAMP domain-containing sensor histidine kinase [Propionicimonas sp.]